MQRTFRSLRKAGQGSSFETLEGRRLFSVVNVTPQSNWLQAINGSQPGDTIKFSAGNYSLTRDTTLPARTYVGADGATVAGSQILRISGGSDVSGLNFSGTAIAIAGSGVNFHGNTLAGATSMTIGTASNVQIVQNTFNSTRNYCLSGYPGNNVVVEYNYVDLRDAVTGGPDSNGEEWLHFVSRNSGLSVSNNYIIGNTLRWAIELQSGMQNLKVDNNYITAQAGSAISCATGGDATAPYAHQGENIDISGNVLLDAHTPDISDCALEIMGDSGVVIHDNYFRGFGTGILNGSGGQANQPIVTSDNILLSREANYNNEQFLWTVPQGIHNNDKTFGARDPSVPAAPTAPTNVGASTDGTPTQIAKAGSASTLDGPSYVAATRSGNLTLAGTSQSVKGATAAQTNPTDSITVSAWVNADSFSSGKRIFQKGSGAGQYRLITTSTGLIRFDLNGVGTLTAPVPSADAWHLITGTYDGGTMSLYVDGVVVASTGVAGQISTTGGALLIGGSTVTDRTGTAKGGQFLTDDARVYTTALSASDVANLYADPS